MAILETFPSRDNSHTILDTDGTAVAKEDNLQFTGLDVTDDSTNEKTEVKAVGLNADSLDDICGGSVLPNIVQSAFNYSTNEQIVGKWIDGKPLYQKTAQITTPTSGANVSVYNTTGMNIDMVVNLDVFLNDAGYRNAGWFFNGSRYINAWWDSGSNIVYMTCPSSYEQGKEAYIIIKYTKTTD